MEHIENYFLYVLEGIKGFFKVLKTKDTKVLKEKRIKVLDT